MSVNLCGAYLVIFKIDTMCTRVLHCDVCVAISWFIHALMLWMSFVVAVPVSQLRASQRKGSKLLLRWMCVCGWFDCSNLMADVIVDFTRVVDVLDVGSILVKVWKTAVLGQMDVDPGI